MPDLWSISGSALRETTNGFKNLYSCSACDVGFVPFIELTSQIKCDVPSAEKLTYACSLCDRKFFSAGTIERHVKLCAVRQKFEICEKIYKSKNMLAFHRLTYGTTDLCHCCERFVFSSSLGLHLIGDHRDKFQFLCNSCIKVFLSRLEIIIHGKNHPKAIYMKKKTLCVTFVVMFLTVLLSYNVMKNGSVKVGKSKSNRYLS
jgi:hypothetical protein